MPTDNIFIRFEPGLVPVLKHGSHDQSSHGRKGRSLRGYEEATAAGRGQRTRGERSAIDDALRQEEENINYLLGRTTKAPSWTGPSDPLFVPKTTLRDRVQSARRSIKAWKQKREKRSLERMSPAQIDRLIAANRERNNRERVRRGLAPTVYKSFDPVYEILQRIFADEVEPSIWVALIEDPRPLNELTGVLGDLVDDMLDAVVPDETIVKFAPGLRPVLKHAKHDQSTHGNGAREVEASDNDSAWDAVLTNEARALDDRMKANPERYNPRGQRDYGLKDGATETRIVRQDGPPRVRDYETNTSAGLNMTEALEVEGSLGMAVSGYGKPLVPVGDERPPQHVYRVMSTQEFDAARERGYIKSDERMNVAAGEGTVTSLRPTGSFYVPTDGSDYRVVRIKYSDEDGWRTDRIDGYIKTQDRVPFDRVDLYTTPVSQLVTKHLGGKHDQKAHGRGGGATNGVSEAPGGGQFSAWGDRAGEISAAASTGPTRETLQKIINDDIEGMISDEEVMQEIALRYDYEIENDVQERMNRTIGIEDEDEEFATREKYYDEVLGDYYMANAYYTRREMVEERFNEDMDSYVSQFSEVYDTYHSGVNRDGEKISFYTQVETVDSYLGEGIDVKGTIYSDDGNWLGEFHRRFEGDGSGGITVTHELLRLEDEAQGTGFAKVFNRQAENYYISHGIDKVNVHAALDGGGYAWAQQGFDFDEKAIRASRNNISYRMEAYLQQPGIPRNLVSDIQGVRTRLETLDLSSPDFPTPKEIADLGRIPGVQTWPGKEIMRGSNWYGTKTLSPSGPRKSTTQKWKEDRAKAAEADLLRYEQLQLDFGESVAMPFGQGSTPNLRY